MKRLAIPAAVVLGTLWSVAASGQEAWVPYQGESSLSLVYSFQTFEDFFRNNEEKSYPFGRSQQQTVFAIVEYGLTDALAIDVTFAYSHTSTSKTPGGPTGANDSGLADTAFGFRWRVVDEFDGTSAPTVTVRVGGIVAGTYDAGLPYSAGDGASGVEAALMIGKDFGNHGLGVYGEAGYRHRAKRVPADLVAQLGLYKTMGAWSANVGFRHVQALSGSNIGDPGFKFQELKEIASYVEAAFGHSSAGGRYIGAHFAQTVDGRNTAKKTVFGFSVTFPF